MAHILKLRIYIIFGQIIFQIFHQFKAFVGLSDCRTIGLSDYSYGPVLNNRLDKYLIDNNLINKCQIGFSKKARTSDHIFVLKTLIDKYIHVNRKGGKLFACFIDLRKAFDIVIHAGIRYKLIKYGISGKLYSIIKDMYRKSELCVRINNKITPTFKSFVGVGAVAIIRQSDSPTNALN